MTGTTVLYLILAGVASAALAFFMYGYRSRVRPGLKLILGILRFLVIFVLLVLLINPQLTSTTYRQQKPNLVLLTDNSASMAELNLDSLSLAIRREIKGNTDLNERFNLADFQFGEDLRSLDSLTFDEPLTNLSRAFDGIQSLYREGRSVAILLSDGNQTLGDDYEFVRSSDPLPIYPIIIGDTIPSDDLAIFQINANRYAFLRNEFPVEVIVNYQGNQRIEANFEVSQGNSVVFTQALTFDAEQNSRTVTFTLPAEAVGVQRYSARVSGLNSERNTTNNQRPFAVEVVDETSEILLVSSMSHPDLGMIKRSIETNEQRKVSIVSPEDALDLLEQVQLVIFYQPNRRFEQILQRCLDQNRSVLFVTGLGTQWNWLNRKQGFFEKEYSRQTENTQGSLDSSYDNFAVSDLDFESLPPLQTSFGELFITVPNKTLLQQNIDGIFSGSPMLSTWESTGGRYGIWDGEGIWKWRARTYLQNGDFTQFDAFLGQLVQYLSSNKQRSRLTVDSETFYYNNGPISIRAQYFDQNYVFDPGNRLNCRLVNTLSGEVINRPMLLRNNYFELDLGNLKAGDYTFEITAEDQGITRSGSFSILDFNLEKQYLSTAVTKLRRMATNRDARVYSLEERDSLYSQLLADQRLQIVQKSEQKIVPLIDWKYLLAVLVFLLAAEWFTRKYNGLI